MTAGDIRVAIEAALGTVPFAVPVTVAYCTSVRDDLRARLPGAQLEVFYRSSELIVEGRLSDVSYKYIAQLPKA